MRKDIILGLTVALCVAFLLAPFASGFPDGLERVAEDLGFAAKSINTQFAIAPMEDYIMPGVAHEGLATSLAGFVGVIITFIVIYFLGRMLARFKGGKGDGNVPLR